MTGKLNPIEVLIMAGVILAIVGAFVVFRSLSPEIRMLSLMLALGALGTVVFVKAARAPRRDSKYDANVAGNHAKTIATASTRSFNAWLGVGLLLSAAMEGIGAYRRFKTGSTEPFWAELAFGGLGVVCIGVALAQRLLKRREA